MTGEQYLAQVEMYLTDLPWRVRRSLAADLAVHLGEMPADEDLVARLGSPRAYAGELRAAAGLTRRRGLLAFVRARRPRNLAIVLVLLLAVAAVAVAVAWASSYQPLSTGSTGLRPIPSREGAVGETVAAFRNGRPFQFGFSIRNTGRFPVRILRMPLQGSLPFVVRRMYIWGSSDSRPMAPQVAFRPFTLEPGQERLIVLRGRYSNCRSWIAGSSAWFVSMPVRVRFLLWTHTVEVKLPHNFVIRMPRHRSPCSSG